MVHCRSKWSWCVSDTTSVAVHPSSCCLFLVVAVLLIVVALFNFTPNGPCQIALQLGDIVKITEQSEHWFRGTGDPHSSSALTDQGIIVSKEPKRGIFPRRYIGVFKYRDPVLKELQTALSEWLRLLRSHYKVPLIHRAHLSPAGSQVFRVFRAA